MKITIVGTGYVGFSLAVLLSQKYNVLLYDINEKKINSVKRGISPIKDAGIDKFISKRNLKLSSTISKSKAYRDANYIVIAAPTNYESFSGKFNTSIVEEIISDSLTYNDKAHIVIKSTIPFGFTRSMRLRHRTDRIFFSPEFLREGKALFDNLYPSRVVIGCSSKAAELFGKMLIECSKKKDNEVELNLIQSEEAEAVKLFANTYLAMRVSFFNELDTFAEVNNLSSNNIINAVCSDSRIGKFYNNPSFGYGGYCLPKDTKQLLNNFKKIPNNIIKSVIDSNYTRKKYITKSIIKKKPKSVGVYKLAMKSDADNFRESAVIDIILMLQEKDIDVIVYEPNFNNAQLKNIKLISNLNDFIKNSDLIIANRMSEEISRVKYKVYTRDIFGEN